ncbi:hypothetical protein [Pseudomonas savastanoi]|uniref:hypothetical protein n=1 Tax=Pseudomonas savastanoi TaxID=29438 RepID=UPI001782BBBD|nr:hypothetical protein [Pseudomonas savastanoi]QOI07918.1 hypothetical protein D5S10_29790 [Pseudomonas savastanoi]
MINTDPTYQTAIALKSALFKLALRDFIRNNDAATVAQAAGEPFCSQPVGEIDAAMTLLMELTYPHSELLLVEIDKISKPVIAEALRARAHEFAKTYTEGYQQDLEIGALINAANQLGVDFRLVRKADNTYYIEDAPYKADSQGV